MGTAVGTKVFVEHGWRASAALSLGWTGWQVIILLLRGPHCQRYTWFGYQGGTEWRKDVVMAGARRVAEEEGRKDTEQGEAEKGDEGPRSSNLSDEKKVIQEMV